MATKKVEIKQSETVIIKRSQINFAPYNPKKHSEESIKKQAKNFKEVGLLGGIVWNSLTGNLVSGHKRIMSLDLIHKNTKETPVDYDVKVEKVELSDKQEKEQNVFMDARSTNTAQDTGLLAILLPEIDTKLAGLDEIEVNLIIAENPDIDFSGGKSDEMKKDFEKIEKPYEDRKQAVKDMKAKIKENIVNEQGANYVTLSFDDYANKAQFLSAFGYDADATVIKGELFYERLQ